MLPNDNSSMIGNWFFKAFIALIVLGAATTSQAQGLADVRLETSRDRGLWRQVEVIRTTHGVPHIRAENLRAAGYALAWLQCEDYGTVTPMELLEATGRLSLIEGYQRVESDFLVLRHRARALKNYGSLSKDVRDVYEGFAAGVNRYIELHRDRFSPHMPTDFTGQDVAAAEMPQLPVRKVRNFLNRMNPPDPARPTRAGDEGKFDAPRDRRDAERERLSVGTVFTSQSLGVGSWLQHSSGAVTTSSYENTRNDPRTTINDQRTTNNEQRSQSNDGSNAWAFAPSRTKSGKAILLRNPHLAWTAGYYEAHLTVPGVIDFYGDFRIGSAFAVIGGFNKHLGWSTTNNSQDLDEIYALDVDPTKPDHYLFDGGSHALKRDLFTVSWRNGEGISTETREFWSTPLGPVIHRAAGKIYVMKFAGDGELRGGDQFLRMMRATSLKEWQGAMKMRARMTSNFTYADRDGNIYYLWNAALPLLPHAPTDDTVAIPALKTSDIWTKYVPFESLPQVLNPPGGYIHNENSSHHYTNVRGAVDPTNAYPNFEEPELSLRSQLAIQLIGGDEKYSLEDVVRLKHNYRTLLADRVKADLIAAVRATNPTGDVATAAALLERWNNTTSPDSRGSTLFEEWWFTYSGLRRPEPRMVPNAQRFAKVWSVSEPFNTPRGLADIPRAVESFVTAVAEVKRRYGAIDVTWGDAHRVRRGTVDVPVGGCGNDMGCFRIMGFTRSDDGKLVATGGDGWVLAVEFGDTPRALSILAYGQSNIPSSPWHADQAEMFAKGEMKKVAFTKADVEKQAIVKYRPGEGKR
ncbi:MAG TPA: penicillin acylase family protein [Pyrinomonadaceae bacterium]